MHGVLTVVSLLKRRWQDAMTDAREDQSINTHSVPNAYECFDDSKSDDRNANVDNKDETSETDEFSFTDDDAEWDDLDVIPVNEQTFRSPSLDYQSPKHTEFEECWECTDCNTINNCNTTRQYNYKCCGCGEVCYIRSQTQTTYQSKWDTHNDYLLRMNMIWICDHCTHINHDMSTNTCAACQESRFAQQVDENVIQCDVCQQYIHSLSFLMHEVHCTKRSERSWWICPKCYGTQPPRNCQCSVCDCKRPTTHEYLKTRLNGDLICGFCKCNFVKDIPAVIQDVIGIYFAMETFGYQNNRGLGVTKSGLTRHYNRGFSEKLYGDVFHNYPSKNVWKIKLNVDEACVVRVDGDTSAGKVYDVTIGVWCTAYRFDSEKGKLLKVPKSYTITGDGRYSYPIFRNNDVIIVELDCEKRTLSFGINEDWYGVAFNDLPNNTECGYKLYMNVRQQGVIVNLIN
eukprot:265991_1